MAEKKREVETGWGVATDQNAIFLRKRWGNMADAVIRFSPRQRVAQSRRENRKSRTAPPAAGRKIKKNIDQINGTAGERK